MRAAPGCGSAQASDALSIDSRRIPVSPELGAPSRSSSSCTRRIRARHRAGDRFAAMDLH